MIDCWVIFQSTHAGWLCHWNDAELWKTKSINFASLWNLFFLISPSILLYKWTDLQNKQLHICAAISNLISSEFIGHQATLNFWSLKLHSKFNTANSESCVIVWVSVAFYCLFKPQSCLQQDGVSSQIICNVCSRYAICYSVMQGAVVTFHIGLKSNIRTSSRHMSSVHLHSHLRTDGNTCIPFSIPNICTLSEIEVK